MSFENPNLNNHVESSEEKVEPTSLAERARKLMSTFFRIEIVGVENIDKIPLDKPIIFLTTHLSDYDVGIVIAALAEKFPRLKVVESSTHKDFKQSPGGYLGRQFAGVENSFTVDFAGGKNAGNGVFNPDNFVPIKESLEEGNPIVMAAYFDPNYQGKTWHLPKKGEMAVCI